MNLYDWNVKILLTLFAMEHSHALMVVLVAAGAMGLVWAAIIALVVFVEKVVPQGVTFGRVVGVALIAGAVLVAVRPEIARSLAGNM